jgi:protein-tyrosine phosphatase
MMSKGTSMAEKTRQLNSDSGKNEFPPILGNPGVPGVISPKMKQNENQGSGFRSNSEETKGPPKGVTIIEDFEGDEEVLCSLPIEKVDDHVYIGNKIGAEELVYLINNRITHIINAAAEIPNYHEATTGIRYFKLQLTDDPRPSVDNLLKNLEPTYNFIISAIRSNPNARIFVHCAAGISRSASIVIYYLMKKNTIGLKQALENLKKLRNSINPNPWYISQLQDAQTIIEHETGKLI